MSFDTSSPFAMAFTIAMGTKLQMEAFLQEILGKLTSYYVALIVPHMQTPPFDWSYVIELLDTSYTC
jgi:hypothetical protein